MLCAISKIKFRDHKLIYLGTADENMYTMGRVGFGQMFIFCSNSKKVAFYFKNATKIFEQNRTKF